MASAERPWKWVQIKLYRPLTSSAAMMYVTRYLYVIIAFHLPHTHLVADFTFSALPYLVVLLQMYSNTVAIICYYY